MTVDVKLFAALRDAAGASHVTAEADTVAGLVRELEDRYGEPFTSRLAASRVIVNTRQVPPDSPQELSENDEIVLLPPFSGG